VISPALSGYDCGRPFSAKGNRGDQASPLGPHDHAFRQLAGKPSRAQPAARLDPGVKVIMALGIDVLPRI
jgi:hypothetical protein